MDVVYVNRNGHPPSCSKYSVPLSDWIRAILIPSILQSLMNDRSHQIVQGKTTSMIDKTYNITMTKE